MSFRRARSVSRFRATTPAYETNSTIYEYGSSGDGTGTGDYSTRLYVYSPNIYGATGRAARAASVARFKDIDNEIIGSGGVTAYDRLARAKSVGRFDHLRARRPYSAYGTHDFDYFDRYTERIRDKTPISLDTHYTHYRPYYWYHTAPRTYYYYFPYDDWRYRPLYSYRSPALYSMAGLDYSYGSRFGDSIGRLSSMKRAMRDIDYDRELRQLRYPTSLTYANLTHGNSLLGRARDEVKRTLHGSRYERLSNPRDYFGRTYVQFEKDGVTNVGASYNGLTKTVDARPSYWKAEDNVERGYELQAQNDDTLDKIYDTQNTVDSSRERLLLDQAGVAPRMYHFDMDSRLARHNVDNTLRLVRDLKQLKHETFNRLSQPWTYGKYVY